MIILIDAMGGDNAPEAIVDGCVDAVSEADGFDILLIGDKDKINNVLSKRNCSTPRIQVHHTSEVIESEDSPTKAIRTKQDSSMVVGFKLLKEKKGDVFVSAGNSGALMVGVRTVLRKVKGVVRPAFGAVLPSKKGNILLVDAGLNTICKPVNYLQFAIMGSIYMKEMFGIEKPTVGLINIGVEAMKGSDAIKQAHSLLSSSDLNYIGYIEGSDVMDGKADVVVTDGFTGNVMLKFLEGTAVFFFGMLKSAYNKNLKTKISALMIKDELKKIKDKVDTDENGGAPILGANGIVLKSHGSSNARTIKSVVLKAYGLAQTTYQDQIIHAFENMRVEEIEDDE